MERIQPTFLSMPHHIPYPLLAVGLIFISLHKALGHGTVTTPVSRVYRVYLEGPESPDSTYSQAAIAVAGPSAYYTWNQISKNVANYADTAFTRS
jgi:chitin-binding protein